MEKIPDSGEARFSPLLNYLSRSADSFCSRCLGVELEHFVVDETAQRPVFYEDAPDGAPGVESILKEMTGFYSEQSYAPGSDGSRRLIGLGRPSVAITLEPGAQLEISIGPVTRLSTLNVLYHEFRSELDPILARHGYRLLALGYQPYALARDIPLIPKQRYHWMDRYFQTTGQHGLCMMRASASTQVSIDFSSEADALLKLRSANALGPLFAFLTDNAPVFEGTLLLPNSNGEKGRGHTQGNGHAAPVSAVASAPAPVSASGLALPPRMARTAVWNDVDPWRCGIAPGSMGANYRFNDYTDYLMRAPAVFSERYLPGGRYESNFEEARSNAEVFSQDELTHEKVEHILSLFFFDNRLKTYVEVRMADSLPWEYALAFSALTAGLFYDPQNLGWMAERLRSIDEPAVALAKSALMRDGWDAEVYGIAALAWLEVLMAQAEEALAEADRPFLAPLKSLVEQRQTLFQKQVLTLSEGGRLL